MVGPMGSSLSIGSRVRLRFADCGEPGEVIAILNRRIRVRWNDLQVETNHRQEALILVERD
jgi:hypothetical protein